MTYQPARWRARWRDRRGRAAAAPSRGRDLRAGRVPRCAARRADPGARGQPEGAHPQLADHRLDDLRPRPARVPLPGGAERRLREHVRVHRQRRSRAPRAGVHRVLPHLPAAQPALEHHPAEGGHGCPLPRRDRDPVPVLVRQLRRAGQARRPVPRLPASGRTTTPLSHGPSARSLSSASPTCASSSGSRWPPASGASAVGAVRRSTRSSWPASSSPPS